MAESSDTTQHSVAATVDAHHTARDWKWWPPWNKAKAPSLSGGLVARLVVDLTLRARIVGCTGAQDVDPDSNQKETMRDSSIRG